MLQEKLNELKSEIKGYCESTKENCESTFEEGVDFLQEFLDEIPVHKDVIDWDYIFGIHGYMLSEEYYDEELTSGQEKELIDFIESLYKYDLDIDKFTPAWHVRDDYYGMNGEKIHSYKPAFELIKEKMETVLTYNNQSPNCLDTSDYGFVYGTIYYFSDEDDYYKLENSYSDLSGWNCASRQYNFEESSISEVKDINENFNVTVLS